MSANIRKIFAFFRLPATNKLLLVKATMLTATLRVCLKIFPFKTVIKGLNHFSKKKKTPENTTEILKKHGWLVDCLYHLHPMLNCLSITTTVWFLLKRKGIKTDMKFGMFKENRKLKAHAWLEHEAKPLSTDKNLKNYIPFSKSIL